MPGFSPVGVVGKHFLSAGCLCLSGTALPLGGQGGFVRLGAAVTATPEHGPDLPAHCRPALRATSLGAERTMALVTSAGQGLRPSGHQPW